MHSEDGNKDEYGVDKGRLGFSEYFAIVFIVGALAWVLTH